MPGTISVSPRVGNTTAAAINNSGEIAGFYTDSGAAFHGFIDNGGLFTTPDGAGVADTSLLGQNNKKKL